MEVTVVIHQDIVPNKSVHAFRRHIHDRGL